MVTPSDRTEVRFAQQSPPTQETESSLRSGAGEAERSEGAKGGGSKIYGRLKDLVGENEKVTFEFKKSGGEVQYEILQNKYGIFYYRFKAEFFKEGETTPLFEEYLCVPMDEDPSGKSTESDLKESFFAAHAYCSRIQMGVNYEKSRGAGGRDDDNEALLKDLQTKDFARIYFVGNENTLVKPGISVRKVKATRQTVGTQSVDHKIGDLAKLKFKQILPGEAMDPAHVKDLPFEQQESYNNIALNQQMREALDAKGDLEQAYIDARAAREELEIPHTPEQIDQAFVENIGKRMNGFETQFDDIYQFFTDTGKLEELRIQEGSLAAETVEEEERIQEKPLLVPRALYDWWKSPLVYERAHELERGVSIYEDAGGADQHHPSIVFGNLEKMRGDLIEIRNALDKELQILEAVKSETTSSKTNNKVDDQLFEGRDLLAKMDKKLAKLKKIGGDFRPPEERADTESSLRVDE